MCDNYVSTVRTLHKLRGLRCPEKAQIHYRLISNGLRRQSDRPVKQADALNHDLLLQFFEQVNFAEELEAVVWVAVLVGFTLILRVSNIGPPARKDFNPKQHFLRSDLIIKEGVPTMAVRWSKTIQYRNKILWVPLIPSQNSRLCAQTWVNKMIRLIPVQPHEPFFLVREGKNRFPLTAGQVNSIIKL